MNVIPFPLHHTRQNEALATLYGAEHAIARTGMNLVVTHGTSDEGDPWISVHQAGSAEVLAHFAVIEGKLVADSPAFSRPMWAMDLRSVIDHVINALRRATKDRPVAGIDVFNAVLIAVAALCITDAEAWHLPLDPERLPELLAEIVPAEVEALVNLVTLVRQSAEAAAGKLQIIFHGEVEDDGAVQDAAAVAPEVPSAALEIPTDLPLEHDTKLDFAKIDGLIRDTAPEAGLPADQFQSKAPAMVFAQIIAEIEATPEAGPSDSEAFATIVRMLEDYPDTTEMVLKDNAIDFYVGGWEGYIAMMYADTRVQIIGVEQGTHIPVDGL